MTAPDVFLFYFFNHDGVADIRYYTLKPLTTLTKNTCPHGSLLNPLYGSAAVAVVVVTFDLFYFVSFWYYYYSLTRTRIIIICVYVKLKMIVLKRRPRFSGFSYIIWFETTADESIHDFLQFFSTLVLLPRRWFTLHKRCRYRYLIFSDKSSCSRWNKIKSRASLVHDCFKALSLFGFFVYYLIWNDCGCEYSRFLQFFLPLSNGYSVASPHSHAMYVQNTFKLIFWTRIMFKVKIINNITIAPLIDDILL